MMGDRLGQQVVETAIVGALGRSVADFEQCLGFSAAHGLMLDGGRGQDARAPGGVIGIERAGKVNAAPSCGALAGDHAVAHDRERMGCGLAAGRLRDVRRFGGRFSSLGSRGRHSLHFSISFSGSSISIPGMNERLTIRNSHFEISRWLPIGRCDADHGSDRRDPDGKPARRDEDHKGNIGAIRTIAATGSFRHRGAD